jgi:DNA end-binding protein Ku
LALVAPSYRVGPDLLDEWIGMMLGDALKDLLKKKQSGQKIEAPREREPSKVVNLMDALRRSVETERAGGERRKPAPRAGHHRAPKKAGRSSARAKKAS